MKTILVEKTVIVELGESQPGYYLGNTGPAFCFPPSPQQIDTPSTFC